MSIEAVTPKQDAAAAAPIATPMPTTTPAVAKVDVAQYTPGGASSATPSDFRELGDVLLGEDMSMMGGDAWTASSAASSSSSSAKPPSLARSATSFLPPQHHHHNVNSTPRHAPPTPQAHQAPPQFFACPPAQLTRHASLPVTMMRPHAINMPVHHAMPFVIAAPPPHMMAAMPPSLHRQRSQGFVMHAAPPPHAFHPMQGPHRIVYHPMPVQIHHPQMPQPNAINVSVSPSPQQQQHKIENPSSKSDSVEPIAFNGASDARMSLGEIDSIALAMFADPKDKKAKDNNDNSDNNDNDDDKIVFKASTASSIGCGQDLERALDSLDKFLPEADTDLFRASDFRPSDLADMVAPVPPSMRPSISSMLVTPRNVQSSTSAPVSGRAALPLLMSPQHSMKTIASPAMQHMHMHQHPHMHLHSSVSTPLHTPRASPKPMATCKVGGCDRRVRSKGFCKTHGGGRKCNIEGCKKSSQNGEFCIGHGGGKKCKHDGCAKAAQSHGLCKAHGGGARCKYPNCNKSSQGGGLCRAHGGGKRCQAAGCPKGAQRGNFCATHGGFRNCHIEGCVRTDRGGGFCEVHRRGRLCKIDGCKKLSRNQGMCTMHIREDKQEEELQQLQQGVAVQ